jgi:GMP synthase PP-ATPase subunit
MINEERPVVAAIHPNLARELRLRKEILELETQRPTKGGLTIFSKLAAEELRLMRESEKVICQELKIQNTKVYEFEVLGVMKRFVLEGDFKKITMYCAALNKKKDNHQIRLEIQKIKGLKKNEIKFLW